MNRWMPKLLILLLTVSIGISVGARAGDYVNWRKSSVDADVLTWDTMHVLERVAEATGWQIYIEPGAQKKFSTKFKERAPDKALDLLLGNLGRVLLPGTNGGPPRLLVFKNKEKDATQLVRPKPVNKAKPLTKELIVTMKKGKSIDDLAKKLGAKVKNRADGLDAGRLEFDTEEEANAARDALRDNEDVASVDLNFPITEQPLAESSGAGSPNLKLQPLKAGEGVIIGLIDSGVQRQGGSMDDFLLNGINVPATLRSIQITHRTAPRCGRRCSRGWTPPPPMATARASACCRLMFTGTRRPPAPSRWPRELPKP